MCLSHDRCAAERDRIRPTMQLDETADRVLELHIGRIDEPEACRGSAGSAAAIARPAVGASDAHDSAPAIAVDTIRCRTSAPTRDCDGGSCFLANNRDQAASEDRASTGPRRGWPAATPAALSGKGTGQAGDCRWSVYDGGDYDGGDYCGRAPAVRYRACSTQSLMGRPRAGPFFMGRASWCVWLTGRGIAPGELRRRFQLGGTRH